MVTALIFALFRKNDFPFLDAIVKCSLFACLHLPSSLINVLFNFPFLFKIQWSLSQLKPFCLCLSVNYFSLLYCYFCLSIVIYCLVFFCFLFSFFRFSIVCWLCIHFLHSLLIIVFHFSFNFLNEFSYFLLFLILFIVSFACSFQVPNLLIILLSKSSCLAL